MIAGEGPSPSCGMFACGRKVGIRFKLAQKINEETHGCVRLDQEAKQDFIDSLKTMPIAICSLLCSLCRYCPGYTGTDLASGTAEANEQHYEVPPELYHIWLGPRPMHCTWNNVALTCGVETLVRQI